MAAPAHMTEQWRQKGRRQAGQRIAGRVGSPAGKAAAGPSAVDGQYDPGGHMVQLSCEPDEKVPGVHTIGSVSALGHM